VNARKISNYFKNNIKGSFKCALLLPLALGFVVGVNSRETKGHCPSGIGVMGVANLKKTSC